MAHRRVKTERASAWTWGPQAHHSEGVWLLCGGIERPPPSATRSTSPLQLSADFAGPLKFTGYLGGALFKWVRGRKFTRRRHLPVGAKLLMRAEQSSAQAWPIRWEIWGCSNGLHPASILRRPSRSCRIAIQEHPTSISRPMI